jgi:plasmid stabilization system protein ParE
MDFRSRPLEILASAAFEMDAAFAWYEQRQAGLGTDFLRACDAAFSGIARVPEAYREIRPQVRRALLRRFPYMVFFRASSERVVVLAVVHVRQSPDVWPFAR